MHAALRSDTQFAAVQIAEPVPDFEEEQQPPKLFRASSAKRLSGKFPASFSRSSTSESSPGLRPADDAFHSKHHEDNRRYYSEKFLAQVGDWLDHERRKAEQRKKTPHHRHRKSNSPPGSHDDAVPSSTECRRERSDSIDSQSSETSSLDRLQRILEDSMLNMGLSSIPHFSPRPPPRTKPRRRGSLKAASSDTDYVDGDAIVPSCDAWLDNSKTLMFPGNASTNDDAETAERVNKEKEAWLIFKNEIIRIAHTLRLKGWRRVELDSGDSIHVERLSGALTNAVYVVTPPSNITEQEGKKQPPKILLRIYGPQVEHLIDRENELKVLGRLARKKIGPRLLGTFKNGRFEQFFNAITLTPENLREPDTSKQIAKRMRELHEGIELLPHERENGAGVWCNWDQWLDNVGRIVEHLDTQLHEATEGVIVRNAVVHAWKTKGYVCGTPWAQFRDMVCKYREHMEKVYKDKRALADRLVFAHNDVGQYHFFCAKTNTNRARLNMVTFSELSQKMSGPHSSRLQTNTNSSS